MISLICLGIGSFFLLITILLTVYTVEQQTAAVIQRFGKFVGVARSGLNFKCPFIDSVAGVVSLKLSQLDVDVETKTKDNVFVHVRVSVQYQVMLEKIYESFYKLTNPHAQMTAYVFDVVRAKVPKTTLDNVFEAKDDIANAVKDELANEMDDFGYVIVKALVTDIDPDEKVKVSMNEINAAQRMRVAAVEKAEAQKILKVKEAEAEAASKVLQGEGIAGQRKAIIDGLRNSVEDFKTAVEGSTAQDVMNLVLMTQYLDTLKEIGVSAQSKVMFIPHSPGALIDLRAQIRDAVLMGNNADINEGKK